MVHISSTTRTSEKDEWVRIFSAYRSQFACVYTGKYVPSTKRKISWRFGFSNQNSILAGRTGHDCKGKEYEVHLTWSVKSGKFKLVWNNQDITNFLDKPDSDDRTEPLPSSFLTLKWNADSGQTFKVITHLAKSPGFKQYDLLINGRSFDSLPTVAELGTLDYVFLYRELHTGSVSFGEQSNLEEDDYNELINYGNELCDQPFEYMSTLETLRNDLTSSIPATINMMSHAIIIAFSDEYDLYNSCNSLGQITVGETEFSHSETSVDAMILEADALWEAYEFMKWNREVRSDDAHDQILSFMQQQVNKMVINVRKGLVPPVDASQVIHSVAAVLELELANPLPRNTVVLLGLRKNVTRSDVLVKMLKYGQVESAAVASGQHGFGVCRFRSTSAVERATDASFRREVVVQDVYPQVLELQKSSTIMFSPFHARIRHQKIVCSLPYSFTSADNDGKLCSIQNNESHVKENNKESQVSDNKVDDQQSRMLLAKNTIRSISLTPKVHPSSFREEQFPILCRAEDDRYTGNSFY